MTDEPPDASLPPRRRTPGGFPRHAPQHRARTHPVVGAGHLGGRRPAGRSAEDSTVRRHHGYPTGYVSTFHSGETITVAWDEMIPHDGHFRIALAVASRNELADPATTADTS